MDLARLSSSHGPLLVTFAACIFAVANACATGIYRRGGTIVTTFLIRCAVVYVFNGLLCWRREGREAAMRVLLLRTGRRRSSLMAAARGLNGAFLGVLLNLSFVLLTFADAFTIFKGVDTVWTIVVSRLLLGSGERLQALELACGALTLLGIVLIAQPPFLARAGGAAASSTSTAISAGGLLVAIIAGSASGGFNVWTRALSRKGGPHDGHLPPAMLLSYFMVVVEAFVLSIALVAHASGLADADGWEWSGMRAPCDAIDVLLLLLYCAGILVGQLTMAAGYRTTRAGVAAFLALTELAFSYVLGVTALGEPTNALATLGTAVVFGSVGALALKPSRPTQPLARADAARQDEQQHECGSSVGTTTQEDEGEGVLRGRGGGEEEVGLESVSEPGSRDRS